MNVFKRSRKAKEHNDAYDSLTGAGSQPPPAPKPPKAPKRKNKNAVDERPQVDLSIALPDTDDFRTSLLMTGLSARFSLLREQHDPHSKMGKASDDSVLFPKRASRMNLFAHNLHALGDIAEVESIRSSFRPPFAGADRTNSFTGTDGYESDGGSIMTRARRGEGNNLFGGRQKLYRVGTTTRGPGDIDGVTSLGKHVYDDDIALSAFQQYRLEERRQRLSEDDHRASRTSEADESDAVNSPILGFSRDRGTHSSTASGRSNLRTSTAATSVASDSPAPRLSTGATSSNPLEISPKLSSENVSNNPAPSAFRKTRNNDAAAGPQLSQSKSVASLRDKFQRSGAVFTSTAGQFVPSVPTSQLDVSVRNQHQSGLSSPHAQEKSPIMQLRSHEDILAHSVNANDRGKATAMALFNKPAREYDEEQFLQRQKKMHEGRNSPYSQTSRSTSRASDSQAGPGPAEKTSSPILRPGHPETKSPSPIPTVPSIAECSKIDDSKTPDPRSSSSSQQSPPRSRSKSHGSAVSKDNVKARLESLIRLQNEELAALENAKLGPERRGVPDIPNIDGGQSPTTFFDNAESSTDGGCDEEREDDQDIEARMSGDLRLPDGDIHPAFRKSAVVSNSKPPSIPEDQAADSNTTLEMHSPTLGMQDSLGLSGLIRSHLRQASNVSSVYPESSPRTSYVLPDLGLNIGSTFDFGDSVATGIGNETTPTVAVTDQTELHATTPTTTMTTTKSQAVVPQAKVWEDPTGPSEDFSHSDEPVSRSALPFMSQPWHGEPDLSHRRDGSSETTRERIQFDADLAERRRKIEEGLKRLPSKQRSRSPIGPPPVQVAQMSAFAQPLTQRAADEVSTRGTRTDADGEREEARGRPAGPPNGHWGPTVDQPGNDSRVIREHRPSSRDAFRDRPLPLPPARSTTPSSRYSRRDRSNSGAAERSKSRHRQHAPAGPMYTSTESSPTQAYHDESNGERRSESRGDSAMSQHRPYYADLNGSSAARASPRPSPISPSSAWNEQMYAQLNGRTTPGGRATPNGRVTPNGRTTPSSGRKRSGTKTQISEPTFISSTSELSLIDRSAASATSQMHISHAPPVPQMNPRRRNTGETRTNPAFSNSIGARGLETVPASPTLGSFAGAGHNGSPETSPNSRLRSQLRKTSSEGGNMAAKMRQQAFRHELQKEALNHPVMPMLSNRSYAGTGINYRGNDAMF